MFDLFFIALAAALGGGDGDDGRTAQGTVAVGEGVVIGEGVTIGGGDSLSDDETAEAANGLLAGVAPGEDTTPPAVTNFEAEPQVPTGKFTTATEVKPIMEMTMGNWVALREYDGKDLLYVTHIWSWRCGLLQMRYAVNGGEMIDWPLPPCHEGTNAPNAIIDTDGLPYATFALGAVQSVEVELLYDDLSTGSARFERSDVLMP